VADVTGEPRLFRVSRVEAVLVADEPVIRRDGISLAGLWEELRRQVDERPAPVRVIAQVRRTRLDMFTRMFAAHLAEGTTDDALANRARVGQSGAGQSAADDREWAVLTLQFAAVQAARVLLSFGGDVVVTSPPEVRDDLLAVAGEVTACYAPVR
jgi:predicted DNA-binding transcriptional regulator YafY